MGERDENDIIDDLASYDLRGPHRRKVGPTGVPMIAKSGKVQENDGYYSIKSITRAGRDLSMTLKLQRLLQSRNSFS